MEEHRRLWVTVVLFVVALALAASAKPVYYIAKERRCLARAQLALQKADYPSAWLSARQVLQFDAGNLRAWRILAGIAEECRLPIVLPLRRHLADLQPNLLQPRLDLADAAVRLGHPLLARVILDAFGQLPAPDGPSGPAWEDAAANLALIARDLGAVELHLAKAAGLDPGHAAREYNLAVVRLSSTNCIVRQTARAQLDQFRSHPDLRADALRSLVADALRQGDWKRAAGFSRELLEDVRVEFNDRLRHLEILAMVDPRAIPPFLARFERQVQHDPEWIYALGGWMLQHGMAAATLDWLAHIQGAAVRDERSSLLGAECLVQERAWVRLEASLRDQTWRKLEFQRLALLALALRAQREFEASGANWQKAVRAAADGLAPLRALVTDAAAWNWPCETEELLWQMARLDPDEPWATDLLLQAYYLDGSTARILDLSVLQLKQHPRSALARNNYSMTSLLLQVNIPVAHALAQDVFSEHPHDPGFASTYALSLHMRRQSVEALQVLDSFGREDLRRPSVATCYGLVLRALGRKSEAEPYLRLAEQGPLLPEECALVQSALMKTEN